jgi:superoxide reductase
MYRSSIGRLLRAIEFMKGGKQMKRREFIKGAVLSAALVSTGRSFAYNGEEEISGAGLLKLQNRDNPSPVEQAHVPVIETSGAIKKGEWFDVNVKVGFMKEHVSKPDHWITFIKLIANGDYVVKAEYELGGVSASSATFRMKVEEETRLQAIAHCNLHGSWLSDPVTVTT